MLEVNFDGKTFRPGALIRPLGSLESLYAYKGFYNNGTTVQAVWLHSKVQLQDTWVEKALQMTLRTFPNLQLCICRRRMRYWFRRVRSLRIDFCLKINEDPLEVFHSMVSTPFDMRNGPLWRACLVTQSDSSGGMFRYVLLFSIQHSMTDAKTNMMICNETIQNMNSIANGIEPTAKPFDLPAPLDDLCKTDICFLLKELFRFPVFSSIFGSDVYSPKPPTRSAATKVLFDKLSIDDTLNLIARCKKEGVTVNTCIISAANFCFVKTCYSLSTKPLGMPTIRAFHAVDCRRYLPHGEGSSSISLQVSFLHTATDHYESTAEFWEKCKEMQEEIHKGLEIQKYPLKIVKPMNYSWPLILLNHHLTKNKLRNKSTIHFITTNMKDLTCYFPEPKEGDCIKVVDVLRSCSHSLSGNCSAIAIETFQRQLSITFEYYTNKMKEEFAKNFQETLMNLLKVLSREEVKTQEENLS